MDGLNQNPKNEAPTTPELKTVDLSGTKPVANTPVTIPVDNAPTTPLPLSDEGLPTLRTFKGDMAGAIKDNDISLSRMVMKEEEKRRIEGVKTATEGRKNSLALILALVLIAIGVGVLVYIFFAEKTGDQKQDQNILPPSLVFSDTQTIIDVTSLKPLDVKTRLAVVEDENLRIGAIKNVILARTRAVGATNQVVPLLTEEAFISLGLTPSERLLRLLEPSFMFGIHSFKNNSGFILLKTNAYQGVFAEMLDWEPRMANDLYKIISGKELPASVKQAVWQDEVVSNIDSRILRNSSTTETFLIYSFLKSH